MKKLTTLPFLILIAFVGGAIINTTEVAAQDQYAKDSRTLGVHHFSLLEGVTSADFENFVREEFEPVIKDMFPGIELLIMKGERNAGSGEYILVYDIQSLWIRDYYFPTTSEESDATEAAVAACGVDCSLIWDKFGEMTEITTWADFVEIVH